MPVTGILDLPMSILCANLAPFPDVYPNRVNYDLSDHVREEIARRRIPLTAVESVLAAPQQKVPEHGQVVCYQSKIDINRKEYLVRVMVNEKMTPAKVVTVYRTSKIRKYWKATQ